MRGRSLLALVAATLLAGACGGGASDDGPRQTAARPGPQATSDVIAPGELGIGGDRRQGPAVIASWRDLELVLPAEDALLVAFHEGSSRAVSLTVEVPARAVLNGEARTQVETDVRALDLPAMVLPSRQRGAAPTTAVDVVLPPSLPVLSPVDGEVVAVEDYALYGRHADTRIVLAPAGRDDVQVSILHVEGPRVRAGDRVEAGVTPVADGARALPIGSQVDRFTVRSHVEDPPPHVHLEVQLR